MDTGWRYRAASVGGVAALVGLAVMLVNNGAVQAIVSTVPVLARLPVDPPTGAEFVIEVALTVVVVTAAFVPLYKHAHGESSTSSRSRTSACSSRCLPSRPSVTSITRTRCRG